tara:strand:+ start:222 stop:521 length:300 start_codon:yes stop_codon:yes gene_type:complete
MEEWTEKEHLEYEEYLKEVKGYFSIDPCCNRHECGTYVLSMKRFLTPFKSDVIPPSKLIEIASLNVGEMMELRDQLDEVITLECERDELERCLKIKDKK